MYIQDQQSIRYNMSRCELDNTDMDRILSMLTLGDSLPQTDSALLQMHASIGKRTLSNAVEKFRLEQEPQILARQPPQAAVRACRLFQSYMTSRFR